MAADTPGDRKQFIVRRIVESRQDNESVVFEANETTIEYENRTLRLELSSDKRDCLDEFLEAYHVFKIKQPETRKAHKSVVYLSAVTDAKHAADFVEALFRDVYGLSKEYELQ